MQLLAHNRQIVRIWAAANRDLLSITPPEAGTTVILQPKAPSDEATLMKSFDQQGVLLVPGSSCFCTEPKPWFRLGYGQQSGALQRGLDGIADLLRGNKHALRRSQ